ncbi:MAG: hypothetical protein M1503_00315 [Thaumarchaeota archaeon]|nr:hypothetical protein [Nitrososphaerota archaeon]MCL5316695.1 hypothetical protein [Nitrososphaerota archaeon]
MKERMLTVYNQYGDFVFPVLTIILLTTLFFIWWKAHKKSLNKTLPLPTDTADSSGTSSYPSTT